jgi:hypothetical protein
MREALRGTPELARKLAALEKKLTARLDVHEAAMFTQNFDNVMMPPKTHILGSPNREG